MNRTYYFRKVNEIVHRLQFDNGPLDDNALTEL